MQSRNEPGRDIGLDQEDASARRQTPVLSRSRSRRIPSRSAVLETQRQLGNAFVQRELQREDASQPAAAQAGPTSLGDGSASVTAAGGVVKVQGSMVELDAGMVRVGGVLQADTIVADSVVASNYTPGAGNVM